MFGDAVRNVMCDVAAVDSGHLRSASLPDGVMPRREGRGPDGLRAILRARRES